MTPSHEAILERASRLLGSSKVTFTPRPDGYYGLGDWTLEYRDGIPVRMFWSPRVRVERKQ